MEYDFIKKELQLSKILLFSVFLKRMISNGHIDASQHVVERQLE